MSEKQLKKRRYIRSTPDPLDVAYLSFDANSIQFQADAVGLIVEESARGGCGLIFRLPIDLKAGQNVKIQLGRMAPLAAEVVWIKPQLESLLFAGFRFLE